MTKSIAGNGTVIAFISVLFIATAYSVSVPAEYVLTAPPRESPEAGEKIYQPLAAYLSQVLGESVIYQHPLTWRNYERRMRNDEFDFVFDGPHFAAWRIESLAAQPLVRLPGELQFVLVVARDNAKVQRLQDLYGRDICTLSAPNLGALSLFSMFPNPVRQPQYYIVDGGFADAAKAFSEGKCSAVILRKGYYYKKADTSFRDATMVLKQSVALTNQGITASWRIKPVLKEKLIRSLTTSAGREAVAPIARRFADSKADFVPSTSQDYAGLNMLQDNSVYGW